MKRMMTTTALLVTGCLNLMLTGCLPETDEAIAAAIESATAEITQATSTHEDHGTTNSGAPNQPIAQPQQQPSAPVPVATNPPTPPINQNPVLVPPQPDPTPPVVVQPPPVVVQPPPVDPVPPPQGPMFPNLRPVCNSGDLNCRLRLDDALGGKLLVFDTDDGQGGAIRNYLYLCASAGFTLIQTVYDGVSPPTTPGIQQFFVSPPGERIVFVTVGVYDSDAWTTQYLQTGDLAIHFQVSIVEPSSAAHLQGQPIYIVLNFDAQGNLYANGSPVQLYYAGEVCFAG